MQNFETSTCSGFVEYAFSASRLSNSLTSTASKLRSEGFMFIPTSMERISGIFPRSARSLSRNISMFSSSPSLNFHITICLIMSFTSLI